MDVATVLLLKVTLSLSVVWPTVEAFGADTRCFEVGPSVVTAPGFVPMSVVA